MVYHTTRETCSPKASTTCSGEAPAWRGLPRYLLKEATQQAWHGAGKSFRRVGGSIPLGDLGGNRVILSRDLRDALVTLDVTAQLC
jgi:hypothetical protein